VRSAARRAAARKGAEHRSEREEAARGEIDPSHHALWKRIGRGIKGTPHERAERFKEYVEENPREEIAALVEHADREVARMVARQTKADRAAAVIEAFTAWRDLDDERERFDLAPIPSRRSSLTPRVKSDTMGSVSRKKRKRRARRASPKKKKVPMARRRRRRSSSALARRAAPKRHHARSSGAKSTGKNLLAIVGAPAALALAENAGISIPTIGAAGEAGTLGLAAYALHYFRIIRSPMLRDAAIGLLGVAAYQGVKQSGLGKRGGVTGDVDGSYDFGYRAEP
jgi:hypothetical protein